MRKWKKYILIIIILLNIIPSKAQEKDFEIGVMDTIMYFGEKLILYENNTWEFLSDIEALQRDRLMADTMQLFLQYWDNEQIFAYNTVNKTLFPDSVTIVLTDKERKFALPFYNTINSGFGWRGRRAHNGIDIKLNKGEPVKAVFDGKVRYAKYNSGGYGKLVIIRHFNGLETYYSHLNHIYVQPDQIVKAGQIIATGGNTGATWAGDHLHFEMRFMDKPFDPMLAIEYDSLRLRSDTLILTSQSFNMTTTHKGAPTGRKGSGSSYSADPNATYHTVRSGDTLGHIAIRYGTSVDRLCRINNISRNTVLQIGKKIRVK
jgi:murein DD-endopeptidase MepM/ murein hydrolase activator NlpD